MHAAWPQTPTSLHPVRGQAAPFRTQLHSDQSKILRPQEKQQAGIARKTLRKKNKRLALLDIKTHSRTSAIQSVNTQTTSSAGTGRPQ